MPATPRIALAATSAAALASLGAPAHAAPASQELIDLTCDNGQTYSALVSGNGEFTPARPVGSTRVLVPIAFVGGMFTATPPGGETQVIEQDDSVAEKGAVRAHNPRQQVSCHYSSSFTLPEDDPESGLPAGTVLTFSGDVVGYVTGR